VTTTPLTEPLRLLNDLDAARAAGTPGEWRVNPDADQEVLCTNGSVGQVWLPRDAALIVAAVNALPQLTAALRAVLAKCDAMEREAAKPQLGGFMADEFRRVVTAALAPTQETRDA
jgi:hypothetical protein